MCTFSFPQCPQLARSYLQTASLRHVPGRGLVKMPPQSVPEGCIDLSRSRASGIRSDLVLTKLSRFLGATCPLRSQSQRAIVGEELFVVDTRHLVATVLTPVHKLQSGFSARLSVDIRTTLFRGSVKGMMCPSPRSTRLSTGMVISSSSIQLLTLTDVCLYLSIPSRLPFAQ